MSPAAKKTAKRPAKKAKRSARPIAVPKKTERSPSSSTSEAGRWASGGELNPGGLYPDAEHPGRFHRKGRGGKQARTVRRVTVYLEDELATELDVHRARAGGLSRSDVLEEALRAYLERH